MRILGIESSCDDTSAALVNASDAGFEILAEKTASQIDIHKKYGGVVPEIAGRAHAEKIVPVIEAVMAEGGTRLRNSFGEARPDAIAVTSGPGLITGLIVGVEAAKTLSYLWDAPLVGVNHIEGHIHSVFLKELGIMNKESGIEFPALCLIVSGGHTELILMADHGIYKKIGKTRDDAAGECFDKVGKLLGFEYPGGPKISKYAEEGNPAAIDFPRPMIDDPSFDFSFAGLKTSALYWLRDNESGIRNKESGTALVDICASFEQAIVDVLVAKTLRAAAQYQPKTIVLAGGVAANKKLRETLHGTITQQFPDSLFLIPDSSHCMDNGAMIAAAGYYHAIKGGYTPWRSLAADPNWHIGE